MRLESMTQSQRDAFDMVVRDSFCICSRKASARFLVNNGLIVRNPETDCGYKLTDEGIRTAIRAGLRTCAAVV